MLTSPSASPDAADSLWELRAAVDDEEFRRRLDEAGEAAYLVDPARRIVFWNRAAEQLTGFLRQQILGRFCADGDLLVHCDDAGANLCQAGCPLAGTLADGRCRAQRVYLRHAEGYRLPVRVRAAPLLDPDGSIVGAIEVFRAAPPEPPRSANAYGLIWFEIDAWEQVLHAYGHHGAHLLVRAVAKTLLHCVGRAGTVARWSGHAFVAVVAGVPGFALEEEMRRLLRLLEQTRIPWWGEHPGATVAAGCALLDPDGNHLEAALARARQAACPSRGVVVGCA